MHSGVPDVTNDEGFYNCASCGGENAVPIRISAGAKLEFVKDCPNCGYPNIIHIKVEEDGEVLVWVCEK